MKKSWYALLEDMKLPLTILLLGSLLTGFSSINTDNETIIMIIRAIGYAGALMKRLFPLAVLVTLVGHKHEDSITVFVALACYLLLAVVTMFYTNGSLNSYFHDTTISAVNTAGNPIYPVNTGIFSPIIIYLIIHSTYQYSRKRYNYGILRFINNDAFFMITAILGTVLAGLGISFLYPHIAKYFLRAIRFISVRSVNPAMMFVYTIIEKILDFTGLHSFIENTFWLGEMGGSWVDVNKVTYLGDVNIWTAQYLSDSVAKGTGRYVASYYITNLFMVPALIIGFYANIGNKIDRSKMTGLAILALAGALISGSHVPLEMLLAFTAPGLLIIHIILSAGVNMILSMLGIQLGYVLKGAIEYANVGNIFDFISYFRSAHLHEAALNMLYVGISVFAIYLLVTFLYYRFLSQDFLESEEGRREMKTFVTALGGINNIEMITSSPVSLIIVLKDDDRLNGELLIQGTRALKVTERYFGIYVDYGPGSSELCRKVKREMRDYRSCCKYHHEAAGQ